MAGMVGLEGPEYLAWLGEQPERDYTILMGANTYRIMYGFVDQSKTPNSDLTADEDAATAELTRRIEGRVLVDARGTLVVGEYPAGQRGRGRGCGSDEAGRRQPDAHDRQRCFVPVPP